MFFAFLTIIFHRFLPSFESTSRSNAFTVFSARIARFSVAFNVSFSSFSWTLKSATRWFACQRNSAYSVIHSKQLFFRWWIGKLYLRSTNICVVVKLRFLLVSETTFIFLCFSFSCAFHKLKLKLLHFVMTPKWNVWTYENVEFTFSSETSRDLTMFCTMKSSSSRSTIFLESWKKIGFGVLIEISFS